jgi:hypothetical protein
MMMMRPVISPSLRKKVLASLTHAENGKLLQGLRRRRAKLQNL